ncbi:hypothetical protein LPJ57_007605, partial [Coemansia sp. RSA 486]
QQPTAINKLLLAHQKKMRELEEQEYDDLTQSQDQDESEDDTYNQADSGQRPSYGLTGSTNIKGKHKKGCIAKENTECRESST